MNATGRMTTSAPHPVPAPAWPVFATGTRVTWRGIPATVIAGNEPNEWVPDFPFVSLRLDRPAQRGAAPYATAYASDVTAL